MSLALALMAAINASTGSCATLSHGLKQPHQASPASARRRQGFSLLMGGGTRGRPGRCRITPGSRLTVGSDEIVPVTAVLRMLCHGLASTTAPRERLPPYSSRRVRDPRALTTLPTATLSPPSLNGADECHICLSRRLRGCSRVDRAERTTRWLGAGCWRTRRCGLSAPTPSRHGRDTPTPCRTFPATRRVSGARSSANVTIVARPTLSTGAWAGGSGGPRNGSGRSRSWVSHGRSLGPSR